MIVRMAVASTLGGGFCNGPVGTFESPGGALVSPGGVFVSPASAETERTMVKAMANIKRFM